MPLAVRIVPTLLVRGRQLVKGKQFNAWRSVGHAVQAVRIHQARGVDELVILDIAATQEGRGPDLQLVEELTRDCFMPIAVGGGVRTVEDVRALLKAGADKVVIRSAGLPLIEEVSKVVGSQAVVYALDVGENAQTWDISLAYSRAAAAENRGAGEILLTRMEREGMMQGYDLDLIKHVSNAVSIPVIAHGGCGSYQHMLEAIEAGADAVAAGALFQFTDSTPAEAAQYLAKRGIETRIAA